ncbi:MAG TPA: TetR family transcriptional regulator [Allosphingosinicella sp.]|nr:TetR family transcriptional regulator [Allosphingosinicella sp.]
MAGERLDRRAARSRKAILSAFTSLVLERRYDSIRIADVIDMADVGRSTFYAHFRSKDDLLRQSMEGLLAMIADSVSPVPDEAKLAFVVAHFWENRRLARAILAPPLGLSVRRLLEVLVEERLADDPERARARAVQIAGAQFALLEAWMRGELAASQALIAERLRAAARL